MLCVCALLSGLMAWVRKADSVGSPRDGGPQLSIPGTDGASDSSDSPDWSGCSDTLAESRVSYLFGMGGGLHNLLSSFWG